MLAIPFRLLRYTRDRVRGRSRPLMLMLDPTLNLLGWMGEATCYGLTDLLPGRNMNDDLPFLAGTIDKLDGEPLVLEFVAMASGRSAHVHLMRDPKGLAVLVLDAQEDWERQQNQQQIANELAITRHQLEGVLRDLEQAHSKLRGKHAELEELDRLKSRFIANMSHEFRTPLTSILGYTDLLRQKHGELAGHELDAVERGSRHLLALIDNLLDQAMLDNGELVIRPVACDPLALLTQTKDMFQSLALQKGLHLATNPSELPKLLMLDEIRLRQVLINLLGNAVKFTQQGAVTVEADWQDNRLAVTIADTGPGIRPEAQETIFQPFRQATARGGQPQKGAGLGLAISRELVRRMGGILSLRSQPGRGSRFRFEIDAPLARPAEPIGDRLEEASPSRWQARILVAEDDEDIRLLLKAHLSNSGYGVNFAVDGHQAVELTLALSPDLVLLDVGLPVLDGPRVAQTLRSRGYAGPIVALSAASTERPRRKALAAGCDDFLTKPIELALLNQTIDHMLKGNALSSTSALSQDVELLQKQYRAVLVDKIKALEDAWRTRRRSPTDAAAKEDLLVLVHQLAGSGASYGFPSISEKAKKAETQLREARGTSEMAEAVIQALLEALRQARE